MKKLLEKIFPFLTILLIPVYLYLGIALALFEIMNDYSGAAGIIYSAACTIGGLTAPLGIAGIILGFILRKKGKKKAGILAPLLGLIVGGTILAGFLILDVAEMIGRQNKMSQWEEEIYGEGWDAPSKIDGIPKHYEELLNKIYVSVREEWGEEKLTDPMIFSDLQTMYYDENPLENLGFAVIDLNGDGDEELVIGPISDVEGYENMFLQVFVEKENPHSIYRSDEDMRHYFHDAGDGTYHVECDMVWEDGTRENILYKITEGLDEYDGYYDIALEQKADPADRTKIRLIPFAEYK